MKGVHAMHLCYMPGCRNAMPSETTLTYSAETEFITKTPLAPGWGLVSMFSANARNDMILVCPEHLPICIEAGCNLLIKRDAKQPC